MKNKKIVVTSNINPDLDGYACALGYAEFLIKQGQNAQAILLGKPLAEVDFVLNYLGEKNTTVLKKTIQGDLIVLVDISGLDTVDKTVNPKKIVEIIDHRPVNESHLYPWAKVQIELVGACATLITERYQLGNINLPINIATYLYGAIASNTINFKSHLSTKRDIQAAKYLKKTANIPDDFVEKMFLAKSDFSGSKLERQIRDDYVEKNIAGKHFTIFQIETISAEHLIKERLPDILKFTEKILTNKKLDFYFINIIDIGQGYNFIISPDNNSRKLLENVLDIKFDGIVAKTNNVIMRKEITAGLKKYFSSR